MSGSGRPIQPGPACNRRRRARPLVGGRRPGDTPLTTRDCAAFLGRSQESIRQAIERGEMKADRVVMNGRMRWLIYNDDFGDYCRAIGVTRLPKVLRG